MTKEYTLEDAREIAKTLPEDFFITELQIALNHNEKEQHWYWVESCEEYRTVKGFSDDFVKKIIVGMEDSYASYKKKEDDSGDEAIYQKLLFDHRNTRAKEYGDVKDSVMVNIFEKIYSLMYITFEGNKDEYMRDIDKKFLNYYYLSKMLDTHFAGTEKMIEEFHTD